MISYVISYVIYLFLAEADIPPAQSRDPVQDGAHDADRQMDFDEERDFADQGPLTDIDMEENAQLLATLLKHLPSFINTADMEHLLVLHI